MTQVCDEGSPVTDLERFIEQYPEVVADHPLVKRRIPVVRDFWPRRSYEMALVITAEDPINPNLASVEPSSREVELLVSYLDYRRSWYNAGWQTKMLAAPLDTDSGTNTTILAKLAKGGWVYRKATWNSGPMVVPPPLREPGSTWPTYHGDDETGAEFGLERLLDRVNDLSSSWVKWRAQAPSPYFSLMEAPTVTYA